MIKLAVEEYCHECPDFDAVVVKEDKSYADHCYTFDGYEYKTVHLHDTKISCRNEGRCKIIEENIRQGLARKYEVK